MILCAVRLLSFVLFLTAVLLITQDSRGAEPKVRITSPKNGSHINQDKDIVLVTGKVSTKGVSISNVDLFLVLDVSASTVHYAGVVFNDEDLPSTSGHGRFGGLHSGIFGGGLGGGRPIMMDLRSSILAAEIAASRRLLSQLNSKSTRVGVITFGESASLLQPLTHDFGRVREALAEVFLSGPHGGTHVLSHQKI